MPAVGIPHSPYHLLHVSSIPFVRTLPLTCSGLVERHPEKKRSLRSMCHLVHLRPVAGIETAPVVRVVVRRAKVVWWPIMQKIVAASAKPQDGWLERTERIAAELSQG